jgi:hypothetical protein
MKINVISVSRGVADGSYSNNLRRLGRPMEVKATSAGSRGDRRKLLTYKKMPARLVPFSHTHNRLRSAAAPDDLRARHRRSRSMPPVAPVLLRAPTTDAAPTPTPVPTPTIFLNDALG